MRAVRPYVGRHARDLRVVAHRGDERPSRSEAPTTFGERARDLGVGEQIREDVVAREDSVELLLPSFAEASEVRHACAY